MRAAAAVTGVRTMSDIRHDPPLGLLLLLCKFFNSDGLILLAVWSLMTAAVLPRRCKATTSFERWDFYSHENKIYIQVAIFKPIF